MQGHILIVIWLLKRALNEIVRAFRFDEALQLRKIVLVQLVVFDKLRGNFTVFEFGQTSYELLFETWHVLCQHFCLLNLVDDD